MSGAQGSIVVRRKPLNGEDAVVYNLILSTENLIMDIDGKIIPKSVNAIIKKTSGKAVEMLNNATLMGKEGLQLYWSDDFHSNMATAAGVEIPLTDKITFINFNLFKGGIVIDKSEIFVSKNGEDGKGNEFIFFRTTNDTRPATPQSPQTDNHVPPGGWSDNPVGVTSTYKYEWISKRTKVKMFWSPFSTPTIFARYAEDGNPGEPGSPGLPGQPGSPGEQGLQGCVLRRTDWAVGFQYRNDSALTSSGFRYIDIVHLPEDPGNVWYECKAYHNGVTSSGSNRPGTSGGNAYWTAANVMAPIYTPLIIADQAYLKFGQGNEFLIQKNSGEITAGMSGSISGNKVRFWAGSASPDYAPFRVNESGQLYASNVNISGVINASEGSIGAFSFGTLYEGDLVAGSWDSGSGNYMRISRNAIQTRINSGDGHARIFISPFVGSMGLSNPIVSIVNQYFNLSEPDVYGIDLRVQGGSRYNYFLRMFTNDTSVIALSSRHFSNDAAWLYRTCISLNRMPTEVQINTISAGTRYKVGWDEGSGMLYIY